MAWIPSTREEEYRLYFILVILQFVNSLGAFSALRSTPAPYGKFSRKGYGPVVNGKIAWPIFESVPLYAFLIPCLWNRPQLTNAQIVLIAIWMAHYFNRSIIYAIRAPSIAPIPVYIIVTGYIFNIMNGYINGRWIGHFGADVLASTKITDPGFAFGVALFLIGMYINISSDTILFDLRRKGRAAHNEQDSTAPTRTETTPRQYGLPLGGWFVLVSCPNYLGEVIQWIGFAIASQGLGGVSFLVFACANMIPRALSNHDWYYQTFGTRYPRYRSAIFPGLL
ncbi:hypothetical protein BASA50_003874 [Batrachochytrium salamandrivorans]|uniref:3-oxo-5-alpha-steroid 4-dehydrogenase C-terminal domain-containing protein n=1 Tax=Batrachochytrium salamandrivorans TaxID=1357716 RepID=A0ABQ8FHI4_9FUNG|nr:hypothetical protein BASA60_001704 [Batrachochytrium salamandrivorans]KAH6597758.1 hypothetical protein BASA61_003022 [Batrachochytrium salamandrivorans]KAH6598260.1 hypothetical protein BASA50_003874 [Batrachochytrium salamandrivorans]KAH9246485.1 hypothetical protein BASA81_015965 [Batrachochytrium salamandrivorans]KAH9265989.1 hypothetical protein BASA84_001331 [Batrachochytrium salamandrivorans]